MDEPPPNLVDLDGYLQRAAAEVGISDDDIFSRLSLAWLPAPGDAGGAAGGAGAPVARPYEAWRRLTLHMRVGWPLKLLVDDETVCR